jgi:hypothetical protein
MKFCKLIITPFLLLSVCMAAQVPQAFNYQAVVRDADNDLITNQTVDFTIAILQNGEVVYEEEHLNEDTGDLGLVNFKVGDGDNPSSDFSAIDWSTGQLQVKLYLNGEEMGVANLVAVPYALYADKSGDSHWDKHNNDLIKYTDGNVQIGETPNYDESNLSLNGHLSIESNAGLLNLSSGRDTGHVYINYFSNGLDNPRTGYIGFPTDGNPVLTLRNEYPGPINLIPESNLTRNYGEFRVIDNASALSLYSDSSDGHVFMSLFNKGVGSNRSGYVGFPSNDSKELRIANEVPGGVIRLLGDKPTETYCLKILGGCDINEDFNSIDQLEPGDVVVIDDANPGQIRRTNVLYDKKVAGIISGANGINPGISLSQEDVLEGDFPLAMVGRVYVKASGKVEVGDMLTTSDTPGYAMAAADPGRSYGAVIGKAMTANESGKGMVLVLVNLQ